MFAWILLCVAFILPALYDSKLVRHSQLAMRRTQVPKEARATPATKNTLETQNNNGVWPVSPRADARPA